MEFILPAVVFFAMGTFVGLAKICDHLSAIREKLEELRFQVELADNNRQNDREGYDPSDPMDHWWRTQGQHQNWQGGGDAS